MPRKTASKLPPASMNPVKARAAGYDVHTIRYVWNESWGEYELRLRGHNGKFVKKIPKRGAIVTLKTKTGRPRKYRVWASGNGRIYTIATVKRSPVKKARRKVAKKARAVRSALSEKEQNKRIQAALKGL